MNTELFIPTKIKIGCVERNGTYLGKLAYVIYYDNKGVLRKETSWQSWRDKKIEPVDYENVPTEGFVLNKKAGGYSNGWNHRSTYCRVFDPRGFEFEISIPNLLFILQETSSFKGKGLEGEFVYAWEGKDLVLLPAHCDEYKKSTEFTELQSGKVTSKDLLIGCKYMSKKNEELIYLGKINYFNDPDYGELIYLENSHVFVGNVNKRYGGKSREFININSLSTLATKVSDTPVENYAELMDEYKNSANNLIIKELELTDSNIPKSIEGYNIDYNSDELVLGFCFKEIEPNKFRYFKLIGLGDATRNSRGYSYFMVFNVKKYVLKSSKVFTFVNNEIIIKTETLKDDKEYTYDEIINMGFKNIVINQENKKTKYLTL